MPSFPTVAEITDDIIANLGLVTGTAVQTYTEPQSIKAINDAFKFVFKKRFWGHLTKNTTHATDGVAGVITDAQILLKDINDIEWVRYEPFEKYNEIYPLKGAPYTNQHEYWYDELFWDDPERENKLLRFYPVEVELNIMIRARRMPDRFVAADTIVPFDQMAISALAASNLLAIDGTNPGGEKRMIDLFDQRYKDLISQESSQISIYGRPSPNTFVVAGT